jgi:imidazole glycerol-phosphate synthase subunit HisF
MLLVDGLCKRIIPCLDVTEGRTVKGVKFTGLRDIGDPVELALRYQEQGADELVFLDITATSDNRKTTFDLVERVAQRLSIPFTVGGGVTTLADVQKLLSCGADKVSVNSSAVARPELLEEIAENCGSQCCVVAIDARRSNTSDDAKSEQDNDRIPRANMKVGIQFNVLVKGGRVDTGMDAFEWAKECVSRGAGEILLTSWDQDGTQSGFDIELVKLFSKSLSVPVIASGGARDAQSFLEVFREGGADAALAASIFHDGIWTVAQIKEVLSQERIPVRT